MGILGHIQRWVGLDHESAYVRQVRWIIRVVVILIPVFFLPVGNFPQELNKTLIFNLLIWLAAGIFLFGLLVKKSGRLYVHPIGWLLVLLGVCILVSGLLSLNLYASFIGSGGVYSTNVVTWLSYLFFVVLLSVSVRSHDERVWLVSGLVLSGSLAVAFGVFQGYGLHLLPWSVTQDLRFNMIAASSLTSAVVAALFSVLALMLFWQYRQRVWKVVWACLVGLNVLAVMMSEKSLAVIILLFMLFIFSVTVAWQAKKFASWEILVPLAALVVLAVGLLIRFPQLTHVQNSTSLLLDQRSSMSIAWRSVSRSPAWGSGPQTFAEDFQSYRPASFNDTQIAGVRFNKSGSEWWGQLATLGTVVVLVQLVIGAWFLLLAGKRLYADWRVKDRQWAWSLGMVAVSLGLWVLFFSMPFNACLYVIWWFWWGVNIRLLQSRSGREKEVVFSQFRFKWFLLGGGLVVVFIVIIFIGYAGIKVWLADYYFFQANQRIQQQASIEDVQLLLRGAIAQNPNEPAYFITLAQGYATAAQLEAGKTDQDKTVIQQAVQGVVDALKQARDAAPHNAIVYEQTAGLYDGLRNIIGNANDLAITAYSELTELEPTNPMAFLNLGRAQLLQSQQLAPSDTEGDTVRSSALVATALDNFRTAKSLQTDYYLADVNIAFALEAQGDLVGAKSALEEAQRIKPDDASISDALSQKINTPQE
ncbi:MAG: hypothetical protein WC544_00240 [Patescibacteria group bacterium]